MRVVPPLLLTITRVVLGPLYAYAVLALFGAVAASAVASASAAGGPGAVARSAPGLAASALPLAIAALASITDFVDGRLARRLRAETRAGAVLDVTADAVFLLCALPALAVAGLVSWWLPAAAAAALSALAVAWRRGAVRPSRARALPDSVGHLAGIVNYGTVLVASGVPLGVVSAGWLPVASVAVAALNVAPIALRWRGR